MFGGLGQVLYFIDQRQQVSREIDNTFGSGYLSISMVKAGS
jgi:hypothetical protein